MEKRRRCATPFFSYREKKTQGGGCSNIPPPPVGRGLNGCAFLGTWGVRNYGTWFSRHPINDGLTGCAFLGARDLRYCGICSLFVQMQAPRKIDVAENVEEVELI